MIYTEFLELMGNVDPLAPDRFKTNCENLIQDKSYMYKIENISSGSHGGQPRVVSFKRVFTNFSSLDQTRRSTGNHVFSFFGRSFGETNL